MYNKGDYVILNDSDLWINNYAIIVSFIEGMYHVRVFFPNFKNFKDYIEFDGNYYILVYSDNILRIMDNNDKKNLKVLLEAKKFNI